MKYPLQCFINNYTGYPITIEALYDTETELLVIGRSDKGLAKRLNNSVLIAESLEVRGADDCFEIADIRAAIDAFIYFKRNNQLHILDNLSMYNPENSFEYDGISDGKKLYRILPSASNGHIAVLAIAYHIYKSKRIEQTLQTSQAFNDITQLLDGLAVTI